ncbi:hypothetical protein ACTXT7_015477 [Hymenolepis weldensis]
MIENDVPESCISKKSLSDIPETNPEEDKMTPNPLMECSQNTTITSRGNGQKFLKLIHSEKDKIGENSCYVPVSDDEFGILCGKKDEEKMDVPQDAYRDITSEHKTFKLKDAEVQMREL